MSKKQLKVLIVDDNPVMVKIMRKMLKNDGYMIFDAWDGRDGIEKAKEIYPDLILVDIIMPDMNGKDVVKILQNDPATTDIPIIFVSNTLSVKDDRGHADIEVNGKKYKIFAKPIHNQKVLSVIRKTINASKDNISGEQ